MSIKFNVPGKKRKELAQTLATWNGTTVTYAGAPTFAYHIGDQVLDRDGILDPGSLVGEALERMLQHLYELGFEFECENEAAPAEEPAPEEPTGITIQIPAATMPESAVANLHALLDAKGGLIKKALGVKELPVNLENDRLVFPWFHGDASPEEAQTYTHFVSTLCEMAKNQKRITAKEKDVDNEKYAFRCFLLRLGFIGSEFKAERKILLRNLTGSAAFKSGVRNEVAE